MKIIFVTPGTGERIGFLSSRNCRISHEIMKHEIYRDASCSVKIAEMVQPCIIVESFNSKFLFLFHEIAEQISNSFFKIEDIAGTSCMKWVENQWSRYSCSPISGKDFARLAGWPEKYIDKSLPVLAKWTEKDRIRPEFSVDGIRLYNFENDRFYNVHKVMAKLFTEWMRDRYNFVLTKGNLFVCPVCGKFIEFSEDVSVCDHYEVEKVFSSDPVYIYNLNIGRQTVDN